MMDLLSRFWRWLESLLDTPCPTCGHPTMICDSWAEQDWAGYWSKCVRLACPSCGKSETWARNLL